MSLMIEAKGLARTFKARSGEVHAVRGVDLNVKSGEIVGFLGPNGAGKTTTLRMLVTLLQPTDGSATVAGCDLRSDAGGVRERIGYVAQSGGTDPNCLVAEELVTQARLYGMSKEAGRARCEELQEQLDLVGLDKRQVKTLSGGQRRRLDIAMGLVNNPELVFLDEPTTGLDPHSRANLWEHILKLRDEMGATVFLTTHYLDEADALCDRIMVIDHGSVVAEGTPEELKRRVSGDIVTVEVEGDTGVVAEAAMDVLKGLEGVRDAAADESVIRLTVDEGDKAMMGVMRALDGAGIGLASIQMARPTLDDVFLTLTGRSLREDNQAGDAGGDEVSGG